MTLDWRPDDTALSFVIAPESRAMLASGQPFTPAEVAAIERGACAHG